MEIHDTETLVRRAHEHAREDHRISQGTYGVVDAGGRGFRGCHIACLATPGEPAELERFLDGLRDNARRLGAETAGGFAVENAGYTVARQLERLEKQFGITEPLSRLGEQVFEHCLVPVEAKLFVVQYAEALHEGADIRPGDVHHFLVETAVALGNPGAGWQGTDQGRRYRDETLNWIDLQRPSRRGPAQAVGFA